METPNIDKILNKVHYARFEIDSGWNGRYLPDSFGHMDPQWGCLVKVTSGGHEIYRFDSMGQKTKTIDNTTLNINGYSLYDELLNRYNKFLDHRDDYIHGVRFFSGTLTLEEGEK